MKGYSSMPNDPLGRYKGVLSLAQLERARRCALQNAEELVSDAELLVQHSRWARGFFLAQIAVEELGKYVMIVSATGNIVMGTMDWKKFWKRYRSHKEKLQNIHLMEEVFFEEEPPKTLDHLPNEVAEFDALKMRALYSEHFFDRVIKPSEFMPEPFARQAVELAGSRLEWQKTYEREIIGRIQLEELTRDRLLKAKLARWRAAMESLREWKGEES
jgi:AbiV family abortive infection protein